jgi:hypothetical protein
MLRVESDTLTEIGLQLAQFHKDNMKRPLLIILFLLIFRVEAWAAYPNYTVCASSCDFTTIALAVADIVANHATPATPVTITATDNSIETATISISGITTSSSNTLTITSSGSGASNGKLQGYQIKPTTGDGISTTVSNIIVKGLAFDMTTSGGSGVKAASGNQSNIKIIGNYFKLTAGYGYLPASISGNHYFYNNICYGSYSYNYSFCTGLSGQAVSNGTNFYIYNNTSYGMGSGFDTDNGTNGTISIYFSNNFSGYNFGPNGAVYRASRAMGGSNNICSDGTSCTTAPLTSGTNNATSYTSYFTSPSTGDFTLKAGSILINAGTNLSGTFTTDIANVTRSVWDVGAFFYNSLFGILSEGGTVIHGGTVNF